MAPPKDPPPNSIECGNRDCDCETLAGIPTWDLVLRALELHTQQAHPAPPGPPAQTRPASSNAKLEKLPRPTFSLLMTEAQWEFIKWTAYISQNDVTPEQKLQQLRAACHPDLLQRVYDAGNFPNLNTDVLLLAAMKKLSVQVPSMRVVWL